MVSPSISLSSTAVIVKYWMVLQFELSKVKGPPEIVNSVEDVAA